MTRATLENAPFAESADDVLENAPCGFLSTLPDGTIVDVNETLVSWTGQTRRALLAGQRFQDLLTVPGRIFYETHFAPLLRMQGFVREIACQLKRAGRAPLQVLVNSNLKVGADGQPLVIRTVIFDATDRVKYEQELRRARSEAQQLAAIVTSSSDAIISVGLDAVVRSWNPGATRIFGYTEAEAAGRSVDELIVPEDRRAERLQKYEIVRSGQQAVFSDTVRRRKDGSLVPVEINASPMLDGEGRVTAVSLIFRDISERKHAENELRRSETKMRLGLEVAGTGLGEIDYCRGTVTLDETAATLFALPANAPLSRSEVHARFHPDDAANISARMAELLHPASTGFMAIDHRLAMPDGSVRWVSAREQVDFGVAPNGARRATTGLLAVSDITERVQRERNLAFLADLTAEITQLSSADEVMQTAGARIAEYLKVAHCNFVNINETAEQAVIIHDHHEAGAQNLAGSYRLADFFDDHSERRQLAAGKTLIVNDVRDGPRLPDATARFSTLCIGALLAVPYIDKGFWKFVLGVQHSQPYVWRTDEVELLQEIAARIYLRLERVSAEENLRESQQLLRAVFDSIDEGFCIVEMIFSTGGKPVDYRFIQANPAMERLTGLKGAIGKTARELAPDLEEFWFETYGKVALTGESIRFEHYSEPMNRWFDVYASRVGNGSRSRVALVFNDITDRKRAEAHRVLLMGEVNHRAKNLLAVVQAVAQLTARDSDPATFAARLSERIQGLAASQDLLVKNQWQGIGVPDLVRAQLAHFTDLIDSRVLLGGPPVHLSPNAAQGIGMALHELATNAAKYGALSNPDGRVRVTWDIVAAPEPLFTMQWIEEGGPEVPAPSRKGFGHQVIKRMVETSVDGKVEIEYRKSGLLWKLTVPPSNITEATPFGR